MVGAFFRGLSSAYGALARLSKPLLAMIFLSAPAVAEPVTLLAFGDSLTQGFGLSPEDGFVAQMQAWLGDHGAAVTMMNAGVSGDTTAGGAARIAWSLTDEVDAVIVALGGNDFLRGLPPEAVRANLDAILAEIGSRGLPVLLVGMQAPGNFGAEYKAAFDAIYPDLAEAHGAALFPDFLQGLADLDDPALVVRDYLQGDAVHPNAAGVALIVARMGPEVLALVDRVP
jgi:acyl-CoA thioesterase-1